MEKKKYSKEFARNKQVFEMYFVVSFCIFAINFCIASVCFCMCNLEMQMQYDVCVQKKVETTLDVWFVVGNILVEKTFSEEKINQAFEFFFKEMKEADQCQTISSPGAKPN